MGRLIGKAKGHSYLFWRFYIHIYPICDSNNFKIFAYPWWYIKLPILVLGPSSNALAWGVVLSRGFEVHFIKNSLKLEWLKRRWKK